jgi:hypothetical protein
LPTAATCRLRVTLCKAHCCSSICVVCLQTKNLFRGSAKSSSVGFWPPEAHKIDANLSMVFELPKPHVFVSACEFGGRESVRMLFLQQYVMGFGVAGVSVVLVNESACLQAIMTFARSFSATHSRTRVQNLRLRHACHPTRSTCTFPTETEQANSSNESIK